MKISFYSVWFVLYVQLLFGLVQLISSEDEESIRIITMDNELKSCHTRGAEGLIVYSFKARM